MEALTERQEIMTQVSGKYLDLIQTFPLRRIRSERELDRAEQVLHRLLDAESLTIAEQDYLEVLGDLIEEYEKKANPVADMAPYEMLAKSMEAKNVTQTEIAKATGIPVSTISELLSQKRDFNVSHIEKLCAYFGLGPSAFIRVPQDELALR
jgi:HTH-type transcriptional regulator/antitoxin HigA